MDDDFGGYDSTREGQGSNEEIMCKDYLFNIHIMPLLLIKVHSLNKKVWLNYLHVRGRCESHLNYL